MVLYELDLNYVDEMARRLERHLDEWLKAL